MAFLDGTDRAYGSMDALVNLPAMQLSRGDDSYVGTFLDIWTKAAVSSEGDQALARIFCSSGTRRAEDEDDQDGHEHFTSLTIRVDVETAHKGFSLYEAVDDLVWTGTQETFLDEIGEILTFEVQNPLPSSEGLGISIPDVFYADRYLEYSISEAQRMNTRKTAILEDARAADEVKRSMTSISGSGKHDNLDAGPIMTKVSDYFRNTQEYIATVMPLDSVDSEVSTQDRTKLMEELAALTKSITEKLTGKSSCRR